MPMQLSGKPVGGVVGKILGNNVVEIRVLRTIFTTQYTIGKLFINQKYVCDTLEDTDRGLSKSTPKNEIMRIKKKYLHHVAIPNGMYPITFTPSSKFMTNYPQSTRRYRDFYFPLTFNSGKMPEIILPVGPDWNGIRIHYGLSNEWSSGCIILGTNITNNNISYENSQKATTIFYQKLHSIIGKDEYFNKNRWHIFCKIVSTKQMSENGIPK